MKKAHSTQKASYNLENREDNKEHVTSSDIIVLLPDSPLELRKKEASKPLYLTRYE